MATLKKPLALWKVLWVICPLTYLVAIALFALAGFVADQATGTTTVIIGGQPVTSVTGEWFRYAWYQAIAVQTVALLHSAFCFCMIIRFKNNTMHAWFRFFAIALSLLYVTYVGYCAYQLFNPDPNIHPISDPF